MTERKPFVPDPGYMEKYANGADWMETHTGRRFFPAAPRFEDLTIFDIAHALSNKCRYAGHSKCFYSVAEHCVTLALFARHLGLPVSTQLHLLMHDGSEAYLPDVPRPIKHHFPDLIVMEHNLDAMIRSWCGLTDDVPSQVKEFDSRMIRDERAQVMLPSDHVWQTDALAPIGVALSGHLPVAAEARFLQAFQHISAEHLGQATLLAYDDEEFAAARADSPGRLLPNIQMIDLLGACALAKNDKGEPFYVNGNFSLTSRL